MAEKIKKEDKKILDDGVKTQIMKIFVDIDVMDFQVGAYYVPDRKITIPTDKIERVAFMESGQCDIKELNHDLKTRKNVFSILSEQEQKRLEEFGKPIGTSGWRGTVEVEIDKNKLYNLLGVTKKKHGGTKNNEK